MRIAWLIGVLVVNAVRCHPEERTALKRQRGAHCKKILHPFVGLVAAVSEQTVVAHADAQTARHPIQEKRQGQPLPAEHEQGNHGSNMKRRHKKSRDPADGFPKRSVMFEKLPCQSVLPSVRARVALMLFGPVAKLTGRSAALCNS